jgi:2,3-bisphosphoglycerate-independent phosphoglycerate mutase
MLRIHKPIVQVILDGWGEWNVTIGNPLKAANLPTINHLDQYYPKLLLEASGMSVGLPWGIMGNSEVGHQTMGAGQIIFEILPTIDMAIQGGSFFTNQAINDALKYAKDSSADLHIWGLLSDGGVHSRFDHLVALLQLAKTKGLKDVFIHVVTDGRDTPPDSAKDYVTKLLTVIKNLGIGKITTITGRYYTMDRNQNWDRIEKSFLAFTRCQGIMEKDPLGAIANQYNKKVYDEYLEPIVMVDDEGIPIGRIKDNDAVICFNFRGDRARQMTRAFTDREFKEFDQAEIPQNVNYTGFTQYDDELKANVAFPPQKITTRLGEILANMGKKQLRIAETEKYAHVTYFFNGGLEEPFANEDRLLVPSKNVPSYADIPEMSAYEITERLINRINEDKYDFILVNYANPDMVGHTGVYPAGIKAVEHVDICLDKLIKAVLEKEGALIITADHGNIEEMINVHNGEVDTKHSTNPVPCWLVTPGSKRTRPLPPDLLPSDIEAMIVDIPATVLELLGITKPKDMTGRSLIPAFALKQNIGQ